MDDSRSDARTVIADATAAFEAGDMAQGLRLVAAGRDRFPDDLELPYLAATAHAASGNFADGVAALEAVLARDPGHARAGALLGVFRGYRDYQRGVEEKRNSRYIDYPPLVHIETFAQCNADCVFCPYATLARKGTRMPDELIAKIVDDLTAIPADLPFAIAPQKVNEPFLDARIFEVFALIAEKLPNARLSINSNGAALTERIVARLAEVANVGRLWISLNDHREDVYEQVMRMKFARTIASLDRLHDAKEKGSIRFPVQIGRVAENTADDDAFTEWVAARYPAFESGLLMRGDWVGQVEIETGRPLAVGCQRWFDLSITATGVVALCCMDGRAEHPVGDVTKTHALEIYNAPAFRALRENAATRLDAGAPCDGCNFL